MSEPQRTPLTSRIVEAFLTGRLAPMLIILSLLAGVAALLVTPREEDPQIVVPLADVMVSVPGVPAGEVETQVASRLEKLLYQIDGVEYVYSTSQANGCVVTVRFFVGQDREDSLIKIYNKLAMNGDQVPPQVAGWVVKPVEIDDVPILGVTFYSESGDDYDLRRVAEQVENKLKEVDDTGRTSVTGGRSRQLLVRVDPIAAAARGVDFLAVQRAFKAINVSMPAGTMDTISGDGRQQPKEIVLDAGQVLRDADDAADMIVGVFQGQPVYLRDIADVSAGPSEPTDYTRLMFGPQAGPDLPPSIRGNTAGRDFPAVTVAVAKRKGANAVAVADALLARLKEIEKQILPAGVHYRITRNYGQTANDKVNELVESLAVAIIIVIALIAITLGWREGLVIAMAVPITFALTLIINYWAGYTINRVTLFALILSLGLVVDDPIVDVENIHRHLQRRGGEGWSPLRAVLDAVNEVRPPIILATMAVIISFLPMFFITGMMGPYMRPMALNVPLAMLMSMVVAFTITPFLAYHMLKRPSHDHDGAESATPLEQTLAYRIYHRALAPFLSHRWARWTLLGVTFLLFIGSGWLAANRSVPLKMLPYDNKNEFQVVVDVDEGATLEHTQAATAALADYLARVPEVTNVTTYVGLASPMDFNGLVRHYYLRRGANVADIRVNVVHKKERQQQSHELTLRLRSDLERIARQQTERIGHGVSIKLVEMPPGPPVLSTVVAEIYGQPFTPYKRLQQAAGIVADRLTAEPGVVDVDTTVLTTQQKFQFVPDRELAARSGISDEQIAATIRMAVDGSDVSVLHAEHDINPTPINVRLPLARRSNIADLDAIAIVPQQGENRMPVRLSEIGHWQEQTVDQAIYHKNLKRVVYVMAEMAGRAPAEAVLDVQADQEFKDAESGMRVPEATKSEFRPVENRSFLRNGGGQPWWVSPDVTVAWAGEGEWKITLDVFRDLGIAFAVACLGIYILLVYETRSYLLPLILMISIPLTVIGIMPGFWLLNKFGGGEIGGFANPTFFTATAMIGMIALSGIVVRNGILLVEFVHQAIAAGKPLRQALLESGAVRFRPIFLTAGTSMLAAWPITLDPIFSGLAWALIFGLFVSTAFTLLIIPAVYYMVYAKK